MNVWNMNLPEACKAFVWINCHATLARGFDKTFEAQKETEASFWTHNYEFHRRDKLNKENVE